MALAPKPQAEVASWSGRRLWIHGDLHPGHLVVPVGMATIAAALEGG
jgi:aminoglycoside phosphotransferase (APT) family kinase protein